MIDFSRIELDNGLVAVVHPDQSTPLVALNVLVQAGSKFDPRHLTGMGHLFEHLMFKGTTSVPDYDLPMQRAAGENNAYTNSDYATYYCSGPKENIETYLYLERDRFTNLLLDQHRLELERKVVLEEYLETCVNEPYGDIWHHLLPMMYSDHPYSWPTIGKNTVHLQDISLADVETFFRQHYTPEKMIVCLSGHIEIDQGEQLLEKYFGELMPKPSSGTDIVIPDPLPAVGGLERRLESDVPVATFYLAWSIPHRLHQDYAVLDVISELLAGSRSSLLYQKLVKETGLTAEIDCYLSGALQGGLFVIDGRLQEGAEFTLVYEKIFEVIAELAIKPLSTTVLSRLKNGMETSMKLSEMNVMSKAINLSYYELLGDIDLINSEQEQYRSIKEDGIMNCAEKYLLERKPNVVEYHPSTN